MFYIEFLNRQDQIVCSANMPTVPKVGEFISDQEKLYKIEKVIYLSKDKNLITLPNGCICVSVFVEDLIIPKTKIEKQAKIIVILLWLSFIIFATYLLTHRYNSSDHFLVPGIGNVVKPKLAPEIAPEELMEEEPPKNKEIYL